MQSPSSTGWRQRQTHDLGKRLLHTKDAIGASWEEGKDEGRGCGGRQTSHLDLLNFLNDCSGNGAAAVPAAPAAAGGRGGSPGGPGAAAVPLHGPRGAGAGRGVAALRGAAAVPAAAASGRPVLRLPALAVASALVIRRLQVRPPEGRVSTRLSSHVCGPSPPPRDVEPQSVSQSVSRAPGASFAEALLGIKKKSLGFSAGCLDSEGERRSPGSQVRPEANEKARTCAGHDLAAGSEIQDAMRVHLKLRS